MKEHKHPKQPYTHNLEKICSVEGCENKGEITTCGFCKQKKRRTKCEEHRYQDYEIRKILSGNLKI